MTWEGQEARHFLERADDTLFWMFAARMACKGIGRFMILIWRSLCLDHLNKQELELLQPLRYPRRNNSQPLH